MIFFHMGLKFGRLTLSRRAFLASLCCLIVMPGPLFANPYASVWQELLKRYVHPAQTNGIQSTVVDYDGLGQSPSFMAIVRYMESAPVPTDTNAALAFWFDAYHMALVATVTAYAPINTPGAVPQFYRTPILTIAGSPMSLTMIQDKIASLTTQPIHLLLTDGTLSSPDFPNTRLDDNDAETQCKRRISDLLHNTTKGLSIESNTRTLYISKYISPDSLTQPPLQDALHHVPVQEYSLRTLPYDDTLNGKNP